MNKGHSFVINESRPQPTRFPELSYEQQGRGNWRIVDTESGKAVGPFYASKAELLADLDRYAKEYGCNA